MAKVSIGGSERECENASMTRKLENALTWRQQVQVRDKQAARSVLVGQRGRG